MQIFFLYEEEYGTIKRKMPVGGKLREQCARLSRRRREPYTIQVLLRCVKD